MSSDNKPYYNALPKSVIPRYYDLKIGDINIGQEWFRGTLSVRLEVKSHTDELHFNYRDLIINHDLVSVKYFKDDIECEVPVNSVQELENKEYFIIKLGDILDPEMTREIVITLTYEGCIQNNMTGFYKSTYKEDGIQKVMLSTQFEATDARRAFPCMDQPDLKAIFEVTLDIPREFVALGNIPVASEESISPSLKRVKFEPSPIMSTYLLAWAFGEFEYVESFTEGLYHNAKPLPVRVYTTKGYKQDAQLASSIAPKIVDYFSQIFNAKYPLPKLDLLAVHAFSHNAMENWGLIAFRSSAVLYSEAKSDPTYKEIVAYVIAHEIAHQWFGNLVTMQWWDELWLNEGFATWVGFTALDYLYPDWNVFDGFVSNSLQTALNLDGLRNSHAIEVPVYNALDIDLVFDAISYLKGASTILMLSKYIGLEKFLKGVAKYLDTNKYGNATTHSLWKSIKEVSGKHIEVMMDSWITKVGHPLVDVDISDNGTLEVSQSRFLNDGGAQKDVDKTIWWIPLNISKGPKLNDCYYVNSQIPSFETQKFELPEFKSAEAFFKLNKDTSGVYRVNYSKKVLETNILPHFDKLSVRDQAGLIADVASIASSGCRETSTVTFLDLLKRLTDSKLVCSDYVVWVEIGKRLKNLLVAFSSSDARLTDGLHNFARYVYEDISHEICDSLLSLESDDSSSFLKLKLQREILNQSAIFSLRRAQNLAEKYFDDWNHGKAVEPSLRAFVFSTIASSESLLDENRLEFMVNEAKNPSTLDAREVTLLSLGHLSNQKFADQVISYLISPDIIPPMDVHFLAQPLSQNIRTKDKFWTFFRNNYDTFWNQLGANIAVFDRFIKGTLANYQSLDMYDQITDFFLKKDCSGFDRSLRQALDNIKINYSWYKRDKEAVEAWLIDNGFMN